MERARLVLLAIAFLSACDEPRPSGPATDAAIERIARPDARLRSFLFRYAYGSNAVLSDVHRLGRDAGCKAISGAVEEAIARHLPTWRRHLVASYREQVPPLELASAAGETPKVAERMLDAYDSNIWGTMGSKNGNLVPTANQEVILAVSKRAARNSQYPLPTERQLRELRYETVGFELCPELQAIIRLEDQ